MASETPSDPSTQQTPSKPSNVREVRTEADLAAALAAATGPVALAFKEEGCPACISDAPALEQVAQDHPELTVLKIDATAPVAGRFEVGAFPSYFLARGGGDVSPEKCRAGPTPGACREVEWAGDIEKALRRK